HPPLPTATQRHPVTGSGITQAAEVRGAARIAAHVEGEVTKRFDLLSQLARGAADATSDPAVRRLLRELELHARRGDDLGRQLALLGRTYPVTPRSVRLNDLLDPLAAALEIEMAPKALEWHLARDLPEVAVDPAAWRLALRSLLRLVGRDLDDEAARLHVTTGQGRFDAEALTQAHAGATGAPGRYQFVQVAGAGRRRSPPQQADAAAFDIGVLSGFTQLHDGILLLSRPEQQTPGAALLLPAPRIPVATAARHPGTPPRVLVAEPEAEDLDQLREIAAGIGIEIVPALDTHEAVRALQDNPQGYAAVMLCHATGAPHLAQDAWLIRQANAGIVLLIASGFNERYAARRFATIGATGFVQKPYVDGELVALLQKHRVLPGAPA
ncbi:MAG: response regulator, partial [Pseudomonadota bacterium]|nr:response regulator [Pseudomonadota bacterium]